MLVETTNSAPLDFPGHHRRRKSTHPDRPGPAALPGRRRRKKRHHVQKLNDSDPWLEGYEARHAGLARASNPYTGIDTQPLWDDGWLEADGLGRVQPG